MRITAEAKARTEEGIRAAARKLFARKGLEGTSTRDIAAAAGIATGTLFNYFPSKEALALTLVAEALEEGRERARKQLAERPGPAVEELFTLIAQAIRALEPMRGYVGEVLEMGLSPLAAGTLSEEGERIRRGHLEDVTGVLARAGRGAPAAALHLYWALFLASLAYWVQDRSPTQEDTRALIDRAVRMFTASLAPAAAAGDEQNLEDRP